MKRYAKYIIFNLIAIVATGVIVYFGRTQPPTWTVLPEVAWIIVVVIFNLIMIAREPRDLRYDLSRACRKTAFPDQLDSIANSYDEVLAKEPFFSQREYLGPISEAYGLIKRQVESNVVQAIDIAEQHPKGKPAHSDYLEELKDYSEQLVEKQGQLVEQAIRLRGIKEDVDTSFVSDFIKAMDAVLESDDLTYEAYLETYGADAKGEHDG
ncbi:MAG: hypothetical protein E7003_07050 [Eggerthellaceae bacterium]|nr:hypothetical protein [Eggerthellaceae bacterium]